MKRFLAVAITTLFFSSPVFAGQVKEVVSERGLKAWLVEEHSIPLIAIKIAFTGSGYAYDPKGKEGRASMMSAMFTEGAGDMDSRAFSEAMESHAISLTASVDEEQFNVSMESLSEHKEKAFSYLGLALSKPRFDEDALERTRRQAISIITQQQQNPGYRAWEAWQKAAFPNHPYSNPPAGTQVSIGGISRDELEQFRTHYLTQQNIVIAVVGDITPDVLSRLLDEYVSGLPHDYKPDAEVAETQIVKPASDKIVVDFNIPQSVVMFGLPAIKRDDPAFYDAYVLNHILGGGGTLTSRLGKELREKRGLTYGADMYLDTAKHAPTWRGQFSTRNEEAVKALDVLKATLKSVATDGITDQELADAKQFITGSFVLNLDSNADIASFLITMQIQNLGMDYMEKRNQLMDAATKEQVMSIAKKLLDMDKLLVVMLGKPAAQPAGVAP